MKKLMMAVGACGVVAAIAVAAQNRGFDGPGRPGGLGGALDADRDGAISAAEIKAAPRALAALDTNGDGRIAMEELRPAFEGGRRGRGEGGERGEARGGESASADDLTETLMAFDKNGDGRLERAEVPERFQGLFDRADGNKDAALTRDELKQSASTTIQEGGRGGEGREGGRGRGRGFVDPLMRVLDRDGDRSLSPEEIAGAAASLQSLDANGDGQLSADEFRPPMGRGREGRRGPR